jgi:hypothetical protein
MPSDTELYNELACYTLARRDPGFIHQHVVDAFTAQHADESTKPIAITFALAGLYLRVEKGFDGRQVQRAHMQLARRRRPWLQPNRPGDLGTIQIADVLAAETEPARDAAIHDWCRSVWAAWSSARGQIVDLVRTELGVE